MADSFEVDQLEHMKRPQLQKLCKELGIKANRKTSLLITNLKKYKETYFARQNQKMKIPLSALKVNENNKVPVPSPTHKTEKETQVENGRQTHQEDEDSFKRDMLIHLENKVKETLKESKIPRLNERNVTFTFKTPTNASSKVKEHIAFKKMDSIDVYLEKRRKRFESFHQNNIKAKSTASKARKIVAEMKALHNTPETMSTEKLNVKKARKSFTTENKTFVFGPIKTPKASEFGFASQKLKTPNFRKSFSTGTKVKENRTPHESRKSFAAITPFRFNANASTANEKSPAPAKRKFDLQESLSKPLSYKPHRGKLAEFKLSTVGSRIPVRNNKIPPSCNKKKVDVKNVKITSRAERREQERNIRANRRKNLTFQRRGLMD